MSFQALFDFESALAEYTGAPYVVLTDGCTHALELCFRHDKIKETAFTPYTYLSIPMLMHHLGIKFEYHSDRLPHRQQWTGEYKFDATELKKAHQWCYDRVKHAMEVFDDALTIVGESLRELQFDIKNGKSLTVDQLQKLIEFLHDIKNSNY